MRDPDASALILITPNLLRKIGFRAIDMIEENVMRGIDINGKSFAPYSSHPFARPAGGIPQRTLDILKSAKAIQYFRSRKTGHLWIRVQGGYVEFKRTWYPQHGGRVNLQSRGVMMSALTFKVNESAREVVIGFSSREAAELAYYHNVTGVGSRKTTRKFLGLLPQQMEEIKRIVSDGITIRF